MAFHLIPLNYIYLSSSDPEAAAAAASHWVLQAKNQHWQIFQIPDVGILIALRYVRSLNVKLGIPSTYFKHCLNLHHTRYSLFNYLNFAFKHEFRELLLFSSTKTTFTVQGSSLTPASAALSCAENRLFKQLLWTRRVHPPSTPCLPLKQELKQQQMEIWGWFGRLYINEGRCEFIPRSDPPSSVYCLRSIIFSALGREEETIPHCRIQAQIHSHIRRRQERSYKILYDILK